MAKDWPDSPRVFKQSKPLRGGSVFEVEVQYTPQECIVIGGEFKPRNLGVGAKVQVSFVTESGGSYPVTRIVEFRDDGRVLGYGDTSNGVRFRRARGEINSAVDIVVSVYSAD
jgi:hypothetical protein